MTLEELLGAQDILWPQLAKAEKSLAFFDQFREANGLLPDRIRTGEMYRNAKNIFDCAFNLVRNMNSAAGPKLIKQSHEYRKKLKEAIK